MPGNTCGIALHGKPGKWAKPHHRTDAQGRPEKKLEIDQTLPRLPIRPQRKAIYRSALASACSRMRLIINLCQMLKIKVRVNLRGRDIGMTQQFLHRTQI